ncbi:MAG: hypothetical protein PHW69_02450 [Elusimicrobiaceae bacterium]|nr:hypothetical protein [Elusimicrobiaceae bacterium]
MKNITKVNLLGLITAVYTVVMLLSLKLRFLDVFLPGTWHGRLGFDFFSIPRSFINLAHGASIYFTRAGDYGPYASWFPYHPAVSLLAGSWLSLFSPWVAYAVFVALSAGLLVYCGYLLGRREGSPVRRAACYVLVLCSPAVYLMLWAGQLQVLAVLAVTLTLADLAEIEAGPPAAERRFRGKLLAGILISLFSKPVLLPALLAFFAVRQCRRTIVLAVGLYAFVSALFLAVPWLNPQSAGLDRLVDVLLNPDHIFRTELYRGITISSYKPEFVNDNAIHWLNMKMRSGVSERYNFEVFSLPAFIGALGVGVKGWLAKTPVLLAAALAGPVYFVKGRADAARCAFWCTAMFVLAFFLSYEAVYEYHYAVALPLIAAAWLKHRSAGGAERGALVLFCCAGALLYAPTPYFLFRHTGLVHHTAAAAAFKDPFISIGLSENIYGWALGWIRAFRVLPACVMFGAAAVCAADCVFRGLARRADAGS